MAGSGPGAPALVERLFQEQSGRLVSCFTRRLGPAHLDLAEEVVQDALLQALQRWPYCGVPSNPAGWLYRVALNAALDAIRRRRWMGAHAEEIARELRRLPAASGKGLGAADDDELRMVLMCCHPALARGSRVALSLRTVGGLSAAEIGRALFSDTRAIEQRLARARADIRRARLSMELPSGRALAPRIRAALDVVYLLFNEGYTAHGGANLIRADLCRQALRLGRLIADARDVGTPDADALVALMSFHAARSPARVDAAGEMVLLDDQDRSRWDQDLIAQGVAYFRRSMRGETESAFHLQAAIAATHAAAPAASQTDWIAILELYDALIEREPSPIARLHRTVAVSKVRGPRAGLDAIRAIANNRSLGRTHLLPAITADLHAQLGHRAEARRHYRTALALKSTEPERRFLERRLRDFDQVSETRSHAC